MFFSFFSLWGTARISGIACFCLFVLAVSLSAAEGGNVQEAQREFEAVFGTEFRNASRSRNVDDRLRLAGHFLELVRDNRLDSDVMRILVLEKAFELASARVEGADLAIEILSLQVELDSERL